jgi:hypothetical protein
VSGSHTYANSGTYSITVKIADVGGSKTQVVCDPAVNNAFGMQVLAAATAPKLPSAGAGPQPSHLGALLLAFALALGTVLGYQLLTGDALRRLRSIRL